MQHVLGSPMMHWAPFFYLLFLFSKHVLLLQKITLFCFVPIADFPGLMLWCLLVSSPKIQDRWLPSLSFTSLLFPAMAGILRTGDWIKVKSQCSLLVSLARLVFTDWHFVNVIILNQTILSWIIISLNFTIELDLFLAHLLFPELVW